MTSGLLHKIIAIAFSYLLRVEVSFIIPQVDPFRPILYQVLSMHTLNPKGHIAHTHISYIGQIQVGLGHTLALLLL